MLRKSLALAAVLGVAISVAASSPAEATHNLDNIVANVNGGVDLGDGPGVGHGPCTSAQGDQGVEYRFTDVVINGLFMAGTSGTASAFNGAVDVDTVLVCSVDDVPLGPLPLLAHGSLAEAGFHSPEPDMNALDPFGDPVCVYGTLLDGGTFSNTGAVSSIASIEASYTVNEPDANGGCTEDPLLRGDEIAATSSAVQLEADVVVAPLGQATGGELQDQVSAQVHTVHAS